MKQFEQDDVIDVAFRTATDDELLSSGQQEAARQTDEEALAELAAEVMSDPERCFCRNCGKPVYKNASVCVHCNYVTNPLALQQGQRLVRARRERYEKGSRIRNFITNLTGIDLESPEQKARWAIRPQNYHYETTGSVYCTNCGCEVDPGASVCVRCNYVLNPLAVRRAQMAVSDRNAKLSRKDLIKSLLIPGYGKKIYKLYAERRPQIAKPCRLAGLANLGALITAAIILLSQL